MKPYARFAHRAETATQLEQADERQVQNNAGGFVFQLDDRKALERFLILGSEGGTYYVSEKKLTEDNAKVVERCLSADGPGTVQVIRAISDAGRAPRNSPAIFALAMAAASPDLATRAAAFAALPTVCRTGTHLFEFVGYARGFRGFGKGLARAITRWYESRTPGQLAYQLVKYQQRGGMSHRDVLRLVHRPGTAGKAPPGVEAALRWAVTGAEGLGTRKVVRKGGLSWEYPDLLKHLPQLISAFEAAKKAENVRDIIRLVTENGLSWEMVPTQHLADPAVWRALLPHMPLEAMVRNLGRMTANGALRPMTAEVGIVLEKLGNEVIMQRARLHPLKVLVALKVYQGGKGEKGKLEWTPIPQVVDALDEAFYASFGSVKPSGKKTMLAIDISGSMDWHNVAGMPITPKTAAAALAMVTARAEKKNDWMVTVFSSGRGMWDHGVKVADISPKQRLNVVIQKINEFPAGGTDCALPMLHALREKIEVDTFAVLTDNETWAGNIHPYVALRQYRQAMKREARLVVVGMTATKFTIADPSDLGMLDVVGFDTATPDLISTFSRGEF